MWMFFLHKSIVWISFMMHGCTFLGFKISSSIHLFIAELGRARTFFGMAQTVFVCGRIVMCTWDVLRQGKESSVTIKKSFSRPVCPAKRRLPSRWASRSSVSSASSPSPPPTVFTQRQTLTYSTYHTETVI